MSNDKKTIHRLLILCISICISFVGFNIGCKTSHEEQSISIPRQNTGAKTGEIIIAKKQISYQTSGSRVIRNSVKPVSVNSGTKVQSLPMMSIVERVDLVVHNTGISNHIVVACGSARNMNHCINTVLGIAKAESSVFKRCYKNSCLGIKPKGELKTYASLQDGISDWVSRYNKYRYNNKNANDMLKRSLYCDGPCEELGSNRRRSFDSFIGYIS